MKDESQIVYLKDATGNFYKLVVKEGNIISQASFSVYRSELSKTGVVEWVYLGERRTETRIKMGETLVDDIVVMQYLIQNPI